MNYGRRTTSGTADGRHKAAAATRTLAWGPPPFESMIAKLHMILEQGVEINFILLIPFMPLTPPFALLPM